MNKKITMLTTPMSIKSAKLLRDEIEKKLQQRVLITRYPENVKGNGIIRYGNSAKVNVMDYNLNSAPFIRFCSYKKSFSNALSGVDFYTPIYHSKDEDLKFPLIIRTCLSLSGGRGIHVINDEENFYNIWRDGYNWTPYIKTEFELRVHIFGDKIVKIFKKIPIENLGDFPIRNNDSCHFSLKEDEKYPKLVSMVEKFSKFISTNFGLSYYALDVGWDKSKKDYLIFEANSAPGLNTNTAQLYAEFISKQILESGN